MPDIPTSEADVDHDFDATASPPPQELPAVRGLLRASDDPADPGHLAEDDEWADIVAGADAAGAALGQPR